MTQQEYISKLELLLASSLRTIERQEREIDFLIMANFNLEQERREEYEIIFGSPVKTSLKRNGNA